MRVLCLLHKPSLDLVSKHSCWKERFACAIASQFLVSRYHGLIFARLDSTRRGPQEITHVVVLCWLLYVALASP